MIADTNVDGAAVTRTERTEGVGRAAAREFARGPRLRRMAGSVGREVIPAREALLWWRGFGQRTCTLPGGGGRRGKESNSCERKKRDQPGGPYSSNS